MAHRKTPFSMVISPTICVTAFFLVIIRKKPIKITAIEIDRQWLKTTPSWSCNTYCWE